MPESSTSDGAGCLHWTNQRVATIARLAITNRSSFSSMYCQYRWHGGPGQDTTEFGLLTGIRQELLVRVLDERERWNKLKAKHGRCRRDDLPHICCFSCHTKRGWREAQDRPGPDGSYQSQGTTSGFWPSTIMTTQIYPERGHRPDMIFDHSSQYVLKAAWSSPLGLRNWPSANSLGFRNWKTSISV